MRNVLIAMFCVVLAATLYGCARQALAAQPTFIDDGNGAYVANVIEACKQAILDTLLEKPDLAKTLTVQDLQEAHRACVAQQGVRAI